MTILIIIQKSLFHLELVRTHNVAFRLGILNEGCVLNGILLNEGICIIHSDRQSLQIPIIGNTLQDPEIDAGRYAANHR